TAMPPAAAIMRIISICIIGMLPMVLVMGIPPIMPCCPPVPDWPAVGADCAASSDDCDPAAGGWWGSADGVWAQAVAPPSAMAIQVARVSLFMVVLLLGTRRIGHHLPIRLGKVAVISSTLPPD